MSEAKVHLDRAHGLKLLREMMRIRAFEARCAELYQAEKIRGFLHLYDGQEAVAVGIMQALEPRDAIFHQGDPARHIYTLTEGTARLTRVLPDGRQAVIGFRFAGDILG
ncbi:MAG: cyclic nucleotide-binding domain-containing protein, partial [Elioraea tepidiphila]